MISVIEYRPYSNLDSPRIAEVWSAQPPQRGLAQPMSAARFEEHVTAKPYFDREGLIIAFDEEHVLGFVHAAFGPAEDHRQLATDCGVILMLLVRPRDDEQEIASALIERAEQYLRSHGAERICAGGVPPQDAFYTGLYGGCELTGVLMSDERAQQFFGAAGYTARASTVVFQRSLIGFRPPIDRQQMQIRRSTSIRSNLCPPPRDWWDAWTKATCDRTQYDLVANTGGELLASIMAWPLEPLASSWGVHAAGIFGTIASDAALNSGQLRYLVGEVLKNLESQGCTLAEIDVPEDDEQMTMLATDLGFQEVDRGAVLEKG